VHALTQEVLAETTLLALEHVRQRLERTVTRAGDRATATAVIEQGVDRLLEHPLLIVDDDLGGAKIKQTLETVVAVDDTTVEIVEIRRRETTAVELNHRAQIRRDHRDAIEDHGDRGVPSRQERVDHTQPLEGARLALARARLDDL